jgi:hypothetical protein
MHEIGCSAFWVKHDLEIGPQILYLLESSAEKLQQQQLLGKRQVGVSGVERYAEPKIGELVAHCGLSSILEHVQ